MSAAPISIPTLRLVNTTGTPETTSLRPEDARHAGWRVAAENHAAAGMSATDARWVFAVQVFRNLTGGRAAALPPEKRAALMSTARNLGLRPFDASLIIAVVQDGARSGEGLGREVEGRLGVIPSRVQGNEPRQHVILLVISFLLGVAGFAALVAWLGA